MPAASDWRSLFPFEPHTLFIDGHQYRYVDEGRGEPLLLVHGNPTWSFYWRELIHHLRDRYRVVAPDHMGCGLSDKPTDFPYCLATHTANLVRLILELDLHDITLVAHDWGGAIGLPAAVAEPDRFARLVLMNTAAFRSPRMPWRIRLCRTPLLGKLAVQGFNAFVRAAQRMAVADPRRLSPAAKTGLLAPYDSWAHRTAIYRFVVDIPMSRAHPSYPVLEKLEGALPRLAHLPVQLIWGMRDWCFTPWFLRRFLDFFPDAEVHRMEDVGHWVMEEAPERVVPLVEQFLAAHPLPVTQASS